MSSIENKSFPRINGAVRHLADIYDENQKRVTNAHFKGLTTVIDYRVGGENQHQLVGQSELQFDLEFFIEEVHKSRFLQYMFGIALDDYGRQRGIFRYEAFASRGIVVFRLPAPLDKPVIIPVNTVVSTRDRLTFTTQEEVIIESGMISAGVEAVATLKGEISNVRAGSIQEIDTLLKVDLSVTNPDEFANGVDAESDEDYKHRLYDWDIHYRVGTGRWFEKVALKVVRDAVFEAKYDPVHETKFWGQGIIFYRPRYNEYPNPDDPTPPEDKDLPLLEDLFTQKEYMLANTLLELKKAKVRVVISQEMAIYVIMSRHYDWEVIKQKINTEIIDYVDGIKLGGLFRMDCVKFLAQSVEGVLEVQLNSEYRDVQLTTAEYAIITVLEIIRKG